MSRNYTPAQKAEIQKRLTELVRTHGRMTFGELRKITGLTIFTARHYLEKAESCGICIRPGEAVFSLRNRLFGFGSRNVKISGLPAF